MPRRSGCHMETPLKNTSSEAGEMAQHQGLFQKMSVAASTHTRWLTAPGNLGPALYIHINKHQNKHWKEKDSTKSLACALANTEPGPQWGGHWWVLACDSSVNWGQVCVGSKKSDFEPQDLSLPTLWHCSEGETKADLCTDGSFKVHTSRVQIKT